MLNIGKAATEGGGEDSVGNGFISDVGTEERMF